MGQAQPRLRRVYTAASAAELLGVDADALRKRGERRRSGSLPPRSPGNPLREWLFDAESIDAQAEGTSEACLWVRDLRSMDGPGDEHPVPAQAAVTPDVLLGDLRDHVEILKTEAAVEREHRLQAEKRVVEAERDTALRELRRVQHAFRALAASVVGPEEIATGNES